MEPDPSGAAAPAGHAYPTAGAMATPMAAAPPHPGLGIALPAQPPDAAAAAAVATAAAAADATASLLTPEEAAQHVTIWNRLERRKIAGNAAPLRRNLGRYLKKHPECEEFNGQDKCIEDLLTIDPATGMPVVAQNEHVPIWHIRDGRKVTGNAAPLRKNLDAYLLKHPECAVYAGQDKEDPSAAAAAAAAAAARAAAAANAHQGTGTAFAAATAAVSASRSTQMSATASGRTGRVPGRPGRPSNAMKAAQAAAAAEAASNQLALQQHQQIQQQSQMQLNTQQFQTGQTAAGHALGATQAQAVIGARAGASGSGSRFVAGGVTPAPRQQPSIFVPGTQPLSGTSQRHIFSTSAVTGAVAGTFTGTGAGAGVFAGTGAGAGTLTGAGAGVVGQSTPAGHERQAGAGLNPTPWSANTGSGAAGLGRMASPEAVPGAGSCSHQGSHCNDQSCEVTYEDIAHSWSYMPSWQNVNACTGAAGAAGSTSAGDFGVPIPSIRGATPGSASRGILSAVGSFDRDVTMGGMSIGNSLGGVDGIGLTPTGGIGSFLFGPGRGVDGVPESPANMDFSPSNFLARGPASPPSSRNM